MIQLLWPGRRECRVRVELVPLRETNSALPGVVVEGGAPEGEPVRGRVPGFDFWAEDGEDGGAVREGSEVFERGAVDGEG